MKITLFTSNQPRHLALIHTLAAVADELCVVQETKTSFPGIREAIHAKSPVMEDYFRRMQAVEKAVFDVPAFTPANARSMALFMGDVSHFPLQTFRAAMDADVYVVFGASYIRGALVDFLVEKRCINIHMGLSPYYRGSACNFWAMYDRRPEMVGSTLHMLTRGLDSGPMLCHALPRAAAVDGYELGMQAVLAAHTALAERIKDGSIFRLQPVVQDRTQEVRYTRSRDFTDEVAGEYLGRLMTPAEIEARLLARGGAPALKDPYFV